MEDGKLNLILEQKNRELKQKDDYIEELRKDLEWHSQKIREYGENLHLSQTRVNELEQKERELEQKDNYIEELRKELKEHSEKLQEYGKSLNWHINRVKELEQQFEVKEEEFEEIRNDDKQEILKLRKKIFEIENSRLWVWTNFLRRGK